MPTNSFSSWIMSVALAVCVFGLHASPEDNQVAEFLREHKMYSLLELQLEDRILNTKDSDERVLFIEELSELYLQQYRSLAEDDPQRALVIQRAWALVDRVGSVPMYELRIELLMGIYLSVESEVELYRLGLLDSDRREAALQDFVSVKREFKQLASKLDPAVEQMQRLSRRANEPREHRVREKLSELLRYRSLVHYYHAWAGYSVAVLNDQHVPSDVFRSFGWLLGAQGGLPQLSELHESTLEMDHVARAAIGVAMAYAQSEDELGGRAWAKYVVESEYVQPETLLIAQDRLLQVLAMQRNWEELHQWMIALSRERGSDDQMSVANARFLALRSLEALQSVRVGKGGKASAYQVARDAIERLVELGEIGHVLDLYKKFDALPEMADSFIPAYAHAVGELNRAQQIGESGLYSTVASLLATALKTPDAYRFPKEREDCQLKLAYAEVRSERFKEAIVVCDDLINRSTSDQSIEEARWIRIAAIDSANARSNKASSSDLDQAVREYILAYPSTPRSAKLILRHAMRGGIDSRTAIDSLAAVQDDDPIVLGARRTLVGLEYKLLQQDRFQSQDQIIRVVQIIRWILENEPAEIENFHDASARLGTLRIGLDLSTRQLVPDTKFAHRMLEQGFDLVRFDSSLEQHRGELVYRQVAVALQDSRFEDAKEFVEELDVIDAAKAQSARILAFNASVKLWEAQQSKRNARRVVDYGAQVIASQIPDHPKPLSNKLSSLVELVVTASAYLYQQHDDHEALSHGLRLAVLVLERGHPSEAGLRLTASLANASGDHERELNAWLRILSAVPSTDDRWYQARYESLRVMKEIDFARALQAYDQYRALYPSLGPPPWNQRIGSLFGDLVPADASTGRGP